MIKAVTFDFWDTLAFDESDEPKRRAAGLAPKAEVRPALFVAEVRRHHPTLPAARVEEAWTAAVARFRHQWKVEHRTPPVASRVDDALRGLGLDRTPGFDRLVTVLEELEIEVPPDPVPGAAACLEALADRYQLGIISDTIVSPGRSVRVLLERWGLLARFDVLVFSDEVGASKPAARVFELAAERFGVRLDELVHIGDREHNDVAGPHGAGARAVLFTGAVDRGSSTTRAEAVCADLTGLPAVIAALG